MHKGTLQSSSRAIWWGRVRPYELIKAKRDGAALGTEDLRAFVAGFTRGSIPEYQMAALCMAIFYRGLNAEELGAWTQAMLESGEVIDLSGIPGIKVDKHSTGGVGDKVSLCLAPLVASCGVPVPMISGRGLGHTGGTLDKLETIPGFSVNLSTEDYRSAVREVGACLIGQTETLVPADKRLYALRDVTATVDCIPLIASSIMSKKLAEGIDALVLDVKVGSGAFMKRVEDARSLASTMIGLGKSMGRRVTAFLTNMDQPLGRAIGNSIEVEEAVSVLQGRGPEDLTELTYVLGSEMMILGGRAADEAAARQELEAAVSSGRALRKLKEIVKCQNGDERAVDDLSLLPRARFSEAVASQEEGVVAGIDTEALGLAAVLLGAGRETVQSRIDPSVGLLVHKKLGDSVRRGDLLVEVLFNDRQRVQEVASRVQRAFTVDRAAPSLRPLVLEKLS